MSFGDFTKDELEHYLKKSSLSIDNNNNKTQALHIEDFFETHNSTYSPYSASELDNGHSSLEFCTTTAATNSQSNLSETHQNGSVANIASQDLNSDKVSPIP